MISRRRKEIFYKVAGPLMKINGLIYRLFRTPKEGEHYVHLGPGQRNYLAGWINVDANKFTAKCDLWADLRNPLPFRDNSIDAFYSHHVVEHLPAVRTHLQDVFRCLKPGGIYRIGGPNGDNAIKKFSEGDLGWFSTFPDHRESLGGRFENFIFCRGEHLTILTFSMLKEFMTEIGYTEITLCKPIEETTNPERFAPCLALEHESDMDTPHTLIIEATKPA